MESRLPIISHETKGEGDTRIMLLPSRNPSHRQNAGMLNVAAYCRVSTLLSSQETSIESQRAHYRKLIKETAGWKLEGIYLEAGVSAAKSQNRPQLKRLLSHCKKGKVDLVLTKSISRFSRNTMDCLELVRMLTRYGVSIRFEKENIDTGTMESELMLSILACLAQEESKNISANMKWSIRKRFANGTYRQSIAPYGYAKQEGRLVIHPKRAAIVREIFGLAQSGANSVRIAETLNRKGIPPIRAGQWNPGTIRAILKNPVYMGDVLYQKNFTDDTYHQRPNKGELDQYYFENHHPAIVDRETFQIVQKLLSCKRCRSKEVETNSFEDTDFTT